jgi:osmotically-inducible protein OsmY
MAKPKSIMAKGAALLLTGSAMIWSAAAPAESQQERDARMSQQVQHEIARQIDEQNETQQIVGPLVVQADGGVVTVKGRVLTHRAATHVLVAAGGTPGVTYVRNELQVLQ